MHRRSTQRPPPANSSSSSAAPPAPSTAASQAGQSAATALHPESEIPSSTATGSASATLQTAPAHANPAPASRKRKSVAFELGQDADQPVIGGEGAHQAEEVETSGASTIIRSRRSSRNSNANRSPSNPADSTTASSSTSTCNSAAPHPQPAPASPSAPSAKALGKRRAVSPSPSTTPSQLPTQQSPRPSASTSFPRKRRKVATSASPAASSPIKKDVDYNLRSRNPLPTNSTTPSTTAPHDDSIAPSVESSAAPHPTPSSPESISTRNKMPRKGSRASRAAKAKANALDDGDRSIDQDRRGEPSSSSAVHNPSTSSSGEHLKKKDGVESGGVEQVVMEIDEEEAHPVVPSPAKNQSEPMNQDDHDEGDGDIEDDEDDQDDDDENSDDDHEDDEEQDHGMMMDEDDEDDFETSLGLMGELAGLGGGSGSGGAGSMGGYGSGGGDSDIIDPPQTYDANGMRLPTSSSSMDDRSALSAAMEAAEMAAAEEERAFGGGGGRSGASLRALQGMMSGMSSRLRTILTSLKSRDGDASSKLISLQDLAELLSVSTEETLAGYFSTSAFVKEIVSILRGDSNSTGGAAVSADGAMSMEEMLAFGIDPAEAGVGGVNEENNVQMMLLACRCLANLMEALPGSAHAVVHAGAVPVLCSKLLEIQYIDLAEQTLSTLEKISEEMPSSIVREGGLGALLTYLDFFSFHVQRTAVTAAANCCRSLSLDSFGMVRDVMPIFKNVLGYPDQRVVEQACLAVVRIVDSYRHYPDKLEALLTVDLLSAIRSLLNPDSTTIGSRTYTQILKMLATAAKASPEVGIVLLELNLADTLYHLLIGVAALAFESNEGPQVLPRQGDDMLVMQNLVQKPKEQIHETLSLVCELLPALPKDGIFDSRAFSGRSSSSKARVKQEEEGTPDLNAPVASSSSLAAPAPVNPVDLASEVKMEGADDVPVVPVVGSRASSRSGKTRDGTKELNNDKRIALLGAGPESRTLVVKRYYALLLPTLVDVYSASVNSQVRTKALLALLKIVNFCDEESLAAILKTVSMASFLAAILSSRDQTPLHTSALQLVELLLVKMPDAYQYFFRREGVIHEVERIAASALLSVAKSKRSSPSRTPRTGAAGGGGDAVGAAGPSGLTRALQQHAGASSSSAYSSLRMPGGDIDPSSPISNPSLDASVQDMVTLRARHIQEHYASADSEPATKAKQELDRVEELVDRLKEIASPLKKLSKEDEKEAANIVKQVAGLFADVQNPLSSFELLATGLVDGLLRFATDVGSEGLSMARRQEILADAFLTQLESEKPTVAFSTLVKRLQESLSRMEQFEVVLAASSPSDDSRRNGPSMLARQLKLRLVADADSDIPRSCSNIIVSIHAIATFQAFNDYLRPRITAATAIADRSTPGSSSAPSGAGRRLSSFLAAFAAANGTSVSPEPAAAPASFFSSPPQPTASGSGTRLSSSVGATTTTPTADSVEAGPSSSQPMRRRSSRLSGKSPSAAGDAPDAPSTSRTTLDQPGDGSHTEDQAMNGEAESSFAAYEEMLNDGDDDLFGGSFDAPVPARDDRPVNLEVAADGSKVIAKTPDGTRVGTPIQGGSASTPTASTAPTPRASYASAVKTSPTDFHLAFSMGDRPVSLETTVYGAVHQFESQTGEPSRNLWQSIFTVKFRKVPGPAPIAKDVDPAEAPSRDESMLTALPASIPVDSQQAKILKLLWVLHTLNMNFGDSSSELPEGAFVNNKLTAKLNRQLEEPMIVASACLPNWANDLPQYFPFLFPFETRFSFLQSTAFGYARLMQKWVGQARADSSRRDDNLGFLGRLQRQKVRISRERILESAFKVFELYGSSRASLEVEFFAEVGSGLGPTLEFYALVSKEFSRKDIGLWREGENTTDLTYVYNVAGLFPKPMDDATSEAGKKKLKIFRVLGQFVAKAMMDSRIIDVHFSRTFMRVVLDNELPLTIPTVKTIDKPLAKSLAYLQKFVDAKEELESDVSKSEEEREAAIKSLEIEGSTVFDLLLDFTLPGHDIPLKEGGKDIVVDIFNLQEYISLVIDWTLRKGVMLQMQEFRSGFSSVFPVRDLQSFTPSELVMMTGAIEEDWSVEGLTNSTKADHGFTMDSRPVRDVISIMSELTLPERREFLSFITGSPRLPIGGFASLSPALTIVRKDGGDGSLPSVMTCVNYVKLPDYTSREIVKARIMTAVKEGAGGFHLS